MVSSKLSIWDYVIFSLMLVLSSAIGLYYGLRRKQQTTREYLTAGGSMHWFPISISLLASFVSAVGLLGLPAEIYTFGIQHFLTGIGFALIMLLSAWIYAPIFYRTKVTSANEYLERRFGVFVRMIGCFLFITQYLLYLSVAIYAPSLALEAVAGVPMTATIIITGCVCTFYTTLGGMRAVVWTDVLQTGFMMLGITIVAVFGTIEVGGIKNVFQKAKQGQRLDLFDFNPDPTVRNTFWSLTLGATLAMISNWTTSQVCVQRFLSASSLKSVKISLYLNAFLMTFVLLCCSFAGLVMYAVYGHCDPRTMKEIKSNDQIIPYFVIKKLSHMPGIAGIYTACLFSGALSTISSGLNSLTAVTVEDIIRRAFPRMTDRKATIISKITACIYGLVIISLSFVVSSVGSMILQLAFLISGVVGTPNFAMFTLGMMVPKANSKGASIGLFFGLTFTAWIGIGAVIYPPNKNPLPISISQCLAVNATVSPVVFKGYDFGLAKLYSVSQYWYGWIGAGTTFLVGWIASLIFHNECDKPDPILLFDVKMELLALLPRKWRPKKSAEVLVMTDMNGDEEVNENTNINMKEAMNLDDKQVLEETRY
eukprot:gene18247-20067_t